MISRGFTISLIISLCHHREQLIIIPGGLAAQLPFTDNDPNLNNHLCVKNDQHRVTDNLEHDRRKFQINHNFLGLIEMCVLRWMTSGGTIYKVIAVFSVRLCEVRLSWYNVLS